MSKLRVGIDINEVLRARWMQFDKFYVQEYGEEGVPVEQPYVFDFFKHYKWKDTVEEIKELREPEDMPENINPLDYQVDKKGDALVDFALFKPKERTTLTSKEVYNRFMYEDYVFEIHGSAQQMYRGLDVHFSRFCLNFSKYIDISIVSKENFLSIPSTLFFLSVLRPKVRKYFFNEHNDEIWNSVDILITADPELLENVPEGKIAIKVTRPFNESIKSNFEIMQVNDLNPIEEDNSKPKSDREKNADKIVDTQYNKHEEFLKIIKNIKE